MSGEVELLRDCVARTVAATRMMTVLVTTLETTVAAVWTDDDNAAVLLDILSTVVATLQTMQRYLVSVEARTSEGRREGEVTP